MDEDECTVTYFNILPNEILGEIFNMLPLDDLQNMIGILGKQKVTNTGVKMMKMKSFDKEIEKLEHDIKVNFKAVERQLVFAQVDVLHSDSFELMIPFTTFQPLHISDPQENWSFHNTKYLLLCTTEKIFQLKVMKKRLSEIL